MKTDYDFDLEKLDINTSMFQYFKNSGTKKNQSSKRKCEQKAEEDTSKRNVNLELLCLKSKKQKLMETHEEELNLMESNIKYLENKLK